MASYSIVLTDQQEQDCVTCGVDFGSFIQRELKRISLEALKRRLSAFVDKLEQQAESAKITDIHVLIEDVIAKQIDPMLVPDPDVKP